MPNTNSDCSSNKSSNTNDNDDLEIIEELSNSFVCSHPNFRYYQVDEEWQRHWCSMLGLECTRIYDRSNGSSDIPLTAPTARCVQHTLGDGNCLFRSLSFVLTGSQQSHTCPEIGRQLIKLIDLFDPHVMKNLYGEVNFTVFFLVS